MSGAERFARKGAGFVTAVLASANAIFLAGVVVGFSARLAERRIKNIEAVQS